MDTIQKDIQILCEDNLDLVPTKWYSVLLSYSFRDIETNEFYIYVVVSGRHKKSVALDLSSCKIRENKLPN